jgi:hypothetical protein
MFCFDCGASSPGFRTVYGRAFDCRNPRDEPSPWLDFMAELGKVAAALSGLATDPERRLRLGARGRAPCVEEFSAERMAERARVLHSEAAARWKGT